MKDEEMKKHKKLIPEDKGIDWQKKLENKAQI